MKLRKKDPWKSAKDYSKELNGLTVNLLVKNIKTATDFAKKIIKVNIVYEDIDFAAIEGYGSNWCIHADHTYETHPVKSLINSIENRGNGIELRLLGCDPDAAELRAREQGYWVLSKTQDKPHGLRECYIVDSSGYCWVPCKKIT